MDKNLEIKMPTDLNGFRIRHFKMLEKMIAQPDKLSNMMFVIKMVSDTTGIAEEELKNYNLKDITAVYLHILNLYSNHKIKPPKKQVKLNGKTYKLIGDFGRDVPAGWHIDVQALEFKFDTEPEYIPAFCYLEEGTTYAQKNDYKAIMYPLDQRKVVMREHFGLGDYIDLTAFFLKKWQQCEIGYLLLKRYNLSTTMTSQKATKRKQSNEQTG
jgi:hypothetical protein